MGRKAKRQEVSGQEVSEQSHEPKLLTQKDGLEVAEEEKEEEEEPNITVFRPDREGVRKVLGDLEADTMEYVWENVTPTDPGITVREVYEAFRKERYVAYTTVMTTMARLARKHLLRASKVEAAYVYTPILTKAEFIDNFVSRILQNLLVSFSQSTEIQLERITTGENTARIAALKAKVAELKKAEEATEAGHQRNTPASSKNTTES